MGTTTSRRYSISIWCNNLISNDRVKASAWRVSACGSSNTTVWIIHGDINHEAEIILCIIDQLLVWLIRGMLHLQPLAVAALPDQPGPTPTHIESSVCP